MASTVSGQTPLADGGGELPGPRGSTVWPPCGRLWRRRWGGRKGGGEGNASSLFKEGAAVLGPCPAQGQEDDLSRTAAERRGLLRCVLECPIEWDGRSQAGDRLFGGMKQLWGVRAAPTKASRSVRGGAGRGGSGAGPGPEVTVGLVAGKGTKISCAPALRGHSYNHRPVVSPQNAPGTLPC